MAVWLVFVIFFDMLAWLGQFCVEFETRFFDKKLAGHITGAKPAVYGDALQVGSG